MAGVGGGFGVDATPPGVPSIERWSAPRAGENCFSADAGLGGGTASRGLRANATGPMAGMVSARITGALGATGGTVPMA
jgi:hypothetical protein